VSQHWREPLDPKRHRDWLSPGIGGEARTAANDSLIPQWAYFVRAAGFTFEFAHLFGLVQAILRFSQKTRASSAWGGRVMQHEWQDWFDRLPKGLTREERRVEVLKSLNEAFDDFSAGMEAPRGLTGEQRREYLIEVVSQIRSGGTDLR
jgi:hypothetical protein